MGGRGICVENSLIDNHNNFSKHAAKQEIGLQWNIGIIRMLTTNNKQNY